MRRPGPKRREKRERPRGAKKWSDRKQAEKLDRYGKGWGELRDVDVFGDVFGDVLGSELGSELGSDDDEERGVAS